MWGVIKGEIPKITPEFLVWATGSIYLDGDNVEGNFRGNAKSTWR